jgi:hypothetical protein
VKRRNFKTSDVHSGHYASGINSLNTDELLFVNPVLTPPGKFDRLHMTVLINGQHRPAYDLGKLAEIWTGNVC